MKTSAKRTALFAFGMVALVAATTVSISVVSSAARRQALKSNNLTGIRHEALTMFPRGSNLEQAASHLEDIGFLCEPMPRGLSDISGPALLCASNGRGYPDYPAINLTVSTRGGLVSGIEVWNIMARSDDDAPLADRETEDNPVALVPDDPPSGQVHVASATIGVTP